MLQLIGLSLIPISVLALAWLAAGYCRPRRRLIVSHKSEKLTDKQLASALLVPDDNGVWRAVMQILDEEGESARSAAQQSVKDHGICASYVGGGEALDRVRARMLDLREAGRVAKPE